MIDWDDPAARARHIEAVGVEQYEADLKAHHQASTVATVNGHAIRPALSRFGRLFMVGTTGKAFRTLSEAEAFARDHEG